MDSYSVFHQSRLNMPKSEIVCKPQGFSPNLKAHRKVGFFVVYRKVRRRMSSEKQIEQEIQDKGLNAPRLTPDHINSVIQSVHFFTAGDGYAGALASSEEFNSLPEGERFINPPQQLDLLTFCVIVLKNGFTVTGESACASPENFNAEIGQKIAYENARNKIWQLEGYLLKEKLYQAELDKQF